METFVLYVNRTRQMPQALHGIIIISSRPTSSSSSSMDCASHRCCDYELITLTFEVRTRLRQSKDRAARRVLMLY